MEGRESTLITRWKKIVGEGKEADRELDTSRRRKRREGEGRENIKDFEVACMAW